MGLANSRITQGYWPRADLRPNHGAGRGDYLLVLAAPESSNILKKQPGRIEFFSRALSPMLVSDCSLPAVVVINAIVWRV